MAGLTQREGCEMGDSKVTVWGKRWRGAGCGGETDGDVLKRGICGNKTGGCGAEELRHSISHLTTLTGSAENTRIHHTLRDHSMWESLKRTRMSALLCTHTHSHAASNYVGLQCLFRGLFARLLLCSFFGFLLPGGCWLSVSKAFDHGGGMKALPQNITLLIIRTVPLN